MSSREAQLYRALDEFEKASKCEDQTVALRYLDDNQNSVTVSPFCIMTDRRAP